MLPAMWNEAACPVFGNTRNLANAWSQDYDGLQYFQESHESLVLGWSSVFSKEEYNMDLAEPHLPVPATIEAGSVTDDLDLVDHEPIPYNPNDKEKEFGSEALEYLAQVDFGPEANDTDQPDPIREKHPSASIDHPKFAIEHCSDLNLDLNKPSGNDELVAYVAPPQGGVQRKKATSPPTATSDWTHHRQESTKAAPGSLHESMKNLRSDTGSATKEQLALSKFKTPTEIDSEDGKMIRASNAREHAVPLPSCSPSKTNRIPVETITELHVLGGQKAAGSLHPANGAYRRVVTRHKALYRSYGSQHREKTKLRNKIVDERLCRGIRFVKGDGTGPTYLMTLDEIRVKVSQSLRENRDRAKASKTKTKA